jgi:signal transduction histidine kinase
VGWGIPLPTTDSATVVEDTFFAGASAGFLRALSEGMHTMSQPFTVLRATLEIASGNASTISQYQRSVDSSLIEVARLAEAMGYVQELLRIASDPSVSAAIDVTTVVEAVREDLVCVFERARVWLDIGWGNELVRIQASSTRFRQCLFYLLQHAVRTTSEGDTIHLSVESTGDGFSVIISSDTPDAKNRELSWSDCLQWNDVSPYLTLADALARTDRGRLQWKDKPFVAALWFPAADGGWCG